MSQNSYQQIVLVEDLVLSWPSSFSGGPVVTDINDVEVITDDLTISMPNATLVPNGTQAIFNNISGIQFELTAFDGISTIAYIASGEIFSIYLYNNSSSNGEWRAVPYGSGATSITTFTTESTDSSITITNGTVTPPNGTINFQLPTSITNLNKVANTGFPVITATTPLTWLTRSIVAGNNIVITNGNGIADNPVINLNANLTALTAISVGNFNISGGEINPVDENTDLIINSNGEGNLSLNGVILDTNRNISNVNNLTVNGVFLNSYTPKAWCTFTDTLIGTNDNIIVLRDGANITSITGSNGMYTLTFITARPNNNYGVLVTTATYLSGGLPWVSTGFSISSAQTTTSCQIAVVDGSGEFIQQAPYGITVQILASS